MNKKEQLEFELSEGIASLPKAGTNAEGEMLVKYIDVQNKIGEVLWREPTTAGECDCTPTMLYDHGGVCRMDGKPIGGPKEFPVPEPLEVMYATTENALNILGEKINELIAYLRHKNL